MINKTARTVGMTMLAGSLALGMGACTKVENKASDATSKAANAAQSATNTQTSDTPTSSDSPSTSNSSTSDSPSSDTSSQDTTTDDGGSDSGGLVTGKVGQEIKTKKYSVKVTKVDENAKSTNEFDKPDAGKHYVAVTMTVTNTGSDKKLIVSSFDMKAKLSDNTSPNADFVSGIGTPLNSDGLFKGDSTSGDVVYQVPQGQKIKSIDVDLDSFSLDGGQTIRVNLG